MLFNKATRSTLEVLQTQIRFILSLSLVLFLFGDTLAGFCPKGEHRLFLQWTSTSPTRIDALLTLLDLWGQMEATKRGFRMCERCIRGNDVNEDETSKNTLTIIDLRIVSLRCGVSMKHSRWSLPVSPCAVPAQSDWEHRARVALQLCDRRLVGLRWT